jgi:hypothetical protein
MLDISLNNYAQSSMRTGLILAEGDSSNFLLLFAHPETAMLHEIEVYIK